MASFTMTASFLGTTTVPTAPARRGMVVAKAVKMAETTSTTIKEETSSKRRDLMFAAAAAALCSVAGVAMADEPKRGTEEAKKKYGPICVTMPTARICNR